MDGDRVFVSSKSLGNVDNKVYVCEHNDAQRGYSTSVAIDNTKPSWSWTEIKIRSLKPIPSFGNSITASNGYVFVGEPLDTTSTRFKVSGSVTIYKLDPKPVIVQIIESEKTKQTLGHQSVRIWILLSSVQAKSLKRKAVHTNSRKLMICKNQWLQLISFSFTNLTNLKLVVLL